MIIGMDFGTTNSGMAVYDGRHLQFVPIDPTNTNATVARTALYITNDRSVFIGRSATDTYYTQNLNRSVKYELVRVGEIELTFAEVGTYYKDVYIEKDVYAPGRLFLSFKMGLSSPNYLGTIVGSSYFFLEDIIATYLYITRRRAETHLGREIDSIVLGRPVRYSDDPQHNELARERMLQAAFRAGYKKVYLEHEPIAAAYYYETTIDHEQNILVFDFGGGTLDISVLRVGNPKTRQVLATGGIPIAGDEFDRKLVSSQLPKHFGEGTTYRTHDGTELPVPSGFYTAFNNWQDLLLLQRTETLETMQQIVRTARHPLKIRALINLVTSSYALKMYDIAEQTKRQLSSSTQTVLQFDGPGFQVRELITRAEFERLIRADVRAITSRIDAVLDEAGLTANEIDAVIRTGGSSQIPVFINLLEERFGADKVRDIDTFTGVTAGLGIIAHGVAQGEINLRCYTPETQYGVEKLYSDPQSPVPLVDLDLMKRLIDLAENRAREEATAKILIGSHPEGDIEAVELALDASGAEAGAATTLEALGLNEHLQAPLLILNPEEHIILMTTEFRLLTRTARELADLRRVGLKLAEVENFHRDAFGRETVSGLARLNAIKDGDKVLVISQGGYGQVLIGKSFTSKLTTAVPYIMQRTLSGELTTLAAIPEGGEVIAVTSAGRAVRIPVGAFSIAVERIIKIPRETMIVGIFGLAQPQEIIMVTASGHAQRLASDSIPQSTPNTNGEKVTSRSNVVSALPYQPGAAWVAVTNQRVLRVHTDDVPLLTPDGTSDYKLLRLKKGERLISLHNA
ncbi:MAG: hypothetical protein OHK0046_45330 [Anaerolineae bacterium]